MSRIKKRLVWLMLPVLAGAWFVMLRPASLGGEATYVMIRGTSMLPTYETGDLVISRRMPSYGVGDIVAYRVPEGDVGEGIVVIHRITGGSAAEGFILQGDNNPDRDYWYPKPEDVVGRAWLQIPKIGILLGLLHAPLPMASLAAAVAIVLVLFPNKKKTPADVTPEPLLAPPGS